MTEITDIIPPLVALPDRDPEVVRLHGLYVEHMMAATGATAQARAAADVHATYLSKPTQSGRQLARANATAKRLETERATAVAQAKTTALELVTAVRRHTPPGPRPKLDQWLAMAETWAAS